MALRLFGIKFLATERTYSSLQIAKFPFAYCGLKIIPDFQRMIFSDFGNLHFNFSKKLEVKIKVTYLSMCYFLIKSNIAYPYIYFFSY